MIVSQKRIRANRRNAQKSTGPRSAAGKRRSSRNSLKHGKYAVLSFEFLKASHLPEDKVKYERLKKSVEKALKSAKPKGKKGRPKAVKKVKIQPIRRKAVKPAPRKKVKPVKAQKKKKATGKKR